MRMLSGVVLTRFAMETAMATATMAIGGIVCAGALEHGTGWNDTGPEPGYFPFYIGLLIVLASLGALVQAFLRRNERQLFLDAEQAGRVLAFFLPMFGFLVLAVLLGLYAATTLYLFAVMTVQGGYRPWRAAPVSVGVALCFYAIFELWFQVPLLKGPIETWLGIH